MTSDNPTKSNFGRSVAVAALLFLLCAAILFALRQGPKPTHLALHGETMGTTWHLSLPDISLDTESLHTAIDALLIDINKQMSTYDPESNLSRFNQHGGTTPFQLPEETIRVMAIAQTVSEQSAGAFDMTVGPIVNAYGFGPTLTAAPPTDEQLAATRAYVGHQLVALDPATSSATKADPRVYCDLSAVAKGYASDAVGEYLESKGIADYMIEIGGEVRIKGQWPDGRPWTLGIEVPDSDVPKVHSAIRMRADGKAQALATSGDYRNFYMEGERRISHTIDARTGKPIEHMLASVSVLHDSCAWADAYATAIMVLGPDEGIALAQRQQLAVYLLVRRPDGTFESRQTSGWPVP